MLGDLSESDNLKNAWAKHVSPFFPIQVPDHGLDLQKLLGYPREALLNS
jgi:hypothetical protein